jgi:hypothetical protein
MSEATIIPQEDISFPRDLQVFLTSVTVQAPTPLPLGWKFTFTTGYGAWALRWGQARVVPTIPWEAELLIRLDESTMIEHTHVANRAIDLDKQYECTTSHYGLIGTIVWTKSQWLYVTCPNGSEKYMKIPWDPYVYLCAFQAIRNSGFYSDNQINFLGTYFDPEWAGKDGIIDDQSFFDVWVPGQMKVYSGFWKYFMTRFVSALTQMRFLSIQNPVVVPEATLRIVGKMSSARRAYLQKEITSFITTELQVGLYKEISSKTVSQIHHTLPPRICMWLKRRR